VNLTSSPEKKQEAIDEAADTMLANFPPPPPKATPEQ
jgi:hypothetical protein